MDRCWIALGDLLSYLTFFLPLYIKKRMRIRQRVSEPLLEQSRTRSQQDPPVQAVLHQVVSLQAALQGKEREVNDLRRELEAAKRAQADLEATNRRMKKAETDRMIALKQQTEIRVAEAENRVKDLQGIKTQLSRELRQAQSELEKTAALLDTRSAELRDAQAYLSKLDDVADSEILQLVNGINSRIFQAASNIANTFRPRYDEQKDGEVSKDATARLKGVLSDDVLLALRAADEPLVVQIALQAAIASCSRWLCTTWNFRDETRPSSFQQIYQSIRGTERQSIAGRWRALSRAHVKRFLQDDAHWQRFASGGVLVDIITNVLLASGVGKPPENLRMELERSYGKTLHEIAHQSLEFQWITGERIVSRDLFVFTVLPGRPFNPSHMVDEWVDPKRARQGVDTHPVLCTTQLGLTREERKEIEGAGDEEGITVVLLKPKVVLMSLLEELSNEQDRVACKTVDQVTSGQAEAS